MADVFISYKSERRAAAEHLAGILQRHGYSVWFDAQLLSGHDYTTRIQQELQGAAAVVVLWCSRSVHSTWVLAEASKAMGQAKLLPVMIEPVDLPMPFNVLDTIDLSAWNAAPTSPLLRRLFGEVQRLVGRKPQVDYDALQELEARWRSYGGLSMAQLPLHAVAEPVPPPLSPPMAPVMAPVMAPPMAPTTALAPPVAEAQPRRRLLLHLAALAAMAVLWGPLMRQCDRLLGWWAGATIRINGQVVTSVISPLLDHEGFLWRTGGYVAVLYVLFGAVTGTLPGSWRQTGFGRGRLANLLTPPRLSLLLTLLVVPAASSISLTYQRDLFLVSGMDGEDWFQLHAALTVFVAVYYNLWAAAAAWLARRPGSG